MSLLFESIRLQDGRLQNLEYHSFRLNQSRRDIFNSTDEIELSKVIYIPDHCKSGIYKCRVTYALKIESIVFQPYVVRTVQKLKLIEDNSITYCHKFTDRTQLNSLFAKRENSDDILIVKNDFITDSSFSNIIFFDGSKWVTPASPLLPGTMRNYLIRENIIIEEEIKISDLKKFVKARLINAMLSFNNGIDIQISHITW
jgi:4-amino-4-deoxychorismate lyase